MFEFDEQIVRAAVRACREAALTLRDIHKPGIPNPCATAGRWGNSLRGWREALRLAELELRTPLLNTARELLERADRERRRIVYGPDPTGWLSLRVDEAYPMAGYYDPWCDEDGRFYRNLPDGYGPTDVIELDSDDPIVRSHVAEFEALFAATEGDREGLGVGADAKEATIVQAFMEALESVSVRIEELLCSTSVHRGPRSHYKDAFEATGATKPLARRLLRLIAECPGNTANRMAGKLDYKDDKPIRAALTDLENYGLIASRGRNSGFDLTREGRAEFDSLG